MKRFVVWNLHQLLSFKSFCLSIILLHFDLHRSVCAYLKNAFPFNHICFVHDPPFYSLSPQTIFFNFLDWNEGSRHFARAGRVQQVLWHFEEGDVSSTSPPLIHNMHLGQWLESQQRRNLMASCPGLSQRCKHLRSKEPETQGIDFWR